MSRYLKSIREHFKKSDLSNKHSWRFKTVTALAGVVVFATTYSLILPAITLTSDRQTLSCAYVAHKHTEDCYVEEPIYDAEGRQAGTQKVLVCGRADYVGHQHDDSCYQDGKLVCQLPEIKAHVHDKDCYKTEKVLTCGLAETSGHSHTDSCYTETSKLICNQEEHTHTDACYSDVVVSTEDRLICGYDDGEEISPAVWSDPEYSEAVLDPETGEVLEEAQLIRDAEIIQDAVVHYHDDSCYETIEHTERQLTCGKEEHTHNDSCYHIDRKLTCGLAEGESHRHSASCYTKQDVLTCTEYQELHTHTMDCYEKGPKGESPEKMGWASYVEDENGNKIVVGDYTHRICGKTEIFLHQHDQNCFSVNTLIEENPVPLAAPETENNDTLTETKISPEEIAFDTEIPVEGADYSLKVSGDAACGIPEDAVFKASAIKEDDSAYDEFSNMAQEAAAEEKEDLNSEDCKTLALFDLSIYDAEGNEIQPSAPLTVQIILDNASADAASEASDLYAVHFKGTSLSEDGEIVDAETTEKVTADSVVTEVINAAETDGAVSFDAGSFSVYAVVYTVDFYWEVDGKTYEFSIPGGGFVSFEQLVEVLGIDGTTDNEDSDTESENVSDESDAVLTLDDVAISDSTREFVANVTNVEFSTPNLVDVSKVDDDTTVGQIKESRGLDVQYSKELTEEQIEEINAQTVEAGDWALISVQPFDSEETITVTMNDGEVFTIRVTDAQISTHVITANGENYLITVIYDDEAKIPMGAKLKVSEITDEDAHFNDYMQRVLGEDEEAGAAGIIGEGEADAEQGLDVNPEGTTNAWSAKPVTVADDSKYARFFDIEIQANGLKVEPKAEVAVQISLADVPTDAQSDMQVVHFGENGDELMKVDTNLDDEKNITELSFVTDGFSVYAIASTGSGLDVNIFNKQYVLVCHDVAVSPEQNTTNGYTQNLRGIPVTVANGKISSSEDVLPVWQLNRRWVNGSYGQQGRWVYWLSTTLNGSTVYLHLADNNEGSTYVANTIQDLRIETRSNSTQYRFYRTDREQSLDLFDNNYSHGFGTYNGQRDYEFFTLYELGDEIYNKVTVHFVDRKGNPIPSTVNYNGQYPGQVTAKGSNIFEIRYDWKSQDEAVVNLKDDFSASGYTYASSHLAGTRTGESELTYEGLTIDEKLHSTGSSLEYYSDRGINSQPNTSTAYPYTYDAGNLAYFPPRIFNFNDELKVFNAKNKEVTYSPAGEDKDVYVILDPMISGTGSGNSSGNSSGSGSDSGGDSMNVEEPNFHKQLDKNPDGTYTLSLSVTGHAKNTSEKPKANILLVVDTSSSMTKTTSNNSTRLKDTKAELKILGEQLLDKNKPGETNPSVELSMISFDGDVTDELAWVHIKSEFTDCVTSDSHLKTHQGTDWEDGLKRALVIANEKKAEEPDQPVFIVFFTDGEPSQYTNFHGQATNNIGYPHWYNYYLSREAANDEMRAIVQAGHRLYGVYAFNEYKYDNNHPKPPYNNEKGEDLLHHAIQYGYNTSVDLKGTYYHYASNKGDLNKAFTSILKSINQIVGFDDVVMNDSITPLTSVGATNDEGKAHGFTYTRSGGKYLDGQPWDGAPPVTYTEESDNELAKITWDLSNCQDLPYGLEDGVTYTVSFTVWPSQEAFDYVTKLNNGFITMDNIPEAVKSCFFKNETTGKYEVRTNPESGPDPENENKVTNEIDYVKKESDIVSELPQGASTDPLHPVVKTSEEGVWPETRSETWYEYNEEDHTWTKHVTTTVVTAFGPPDKNMVLDDSAFKIQKEWQVSREEEMIYYLYDVTTGLPIDAHKNILFNVQNVDDLDDPEDFAKVDLGYDEALHDYKWADTTHTVIVHDIPHNVGRIWEKNLDISYGQMISPEFAALRNLYLKDSRYIPIYASEEAKQTHTVSYYVLEMGHDYKIEEPTLDYRFEFQTEIYHPMLVNGTPSNVKIAYHGSGNDKYGILEEAESVSVLKGKNVLRGDLKMRKVVIGPDGVPVTDSDAVFDFKVTLTNNDHPGPFQDDPNNPDQHNIPWYGVKVNGEGEYLYYHKKIPNEDGSYEYTDELHACKDGNYLHGLLPGYEGNRMNQEDDTSRNVVWADIKMKATDVWNITNIPSGTTYEIEEFVTKGYDFVDAVELGSNPLIKVESPADPIINGSIGLNTTKEVEFKNEQRLEFDITKVDVNDLDKPDAEPLAGAAFKLEKYTNNTFRGVDTSWGTRGSKTATETVENPGKFHFEGLKEGYYKLIETAWPDGYVKQATDPMIQVVFNRDLGQFEMKLLVYDDNRNLVQAENNRAGNVKIETIQRPVQEQTSDVGDGETDIDPEGGNGQEIVTENVLVLTYGNTPGAALPNTGGPGTRLFTILGSILILGAGLMLWRKHVTI